MGGGAEGPGLEIYHNINKARVQIMVGCDEKQLLSLPGNLFISPTFISFLLLHNNIKFIC